MASFLVRRYYYSHELPAQVQAQRIKNNSKTTTIYIFHSEDDIPLSPGAMKAWASVILDPGEEVNLANHASINQHGCPLSHPDYDICIHADAGIDIDIESSDLCDRWNYDPHHPWNGSPYPNGTYTKKHTPVAINTSFPVTAILPQASKGRVINVNIVKSVDFIPINITIAAGPKCTCGEKGNRTPGKCSYWCDLELDKNKQIL